MGKQNRDKSILFEALGITASAVILLLWQEACFSPAGVLLLGLLALSYFNYVVGNRDVLYPAFTFTAIWTAVTTVYLTCPIDIRPLGWKTIAILLGGTTFFSIGSLIGNRPFYLKGCKDKKNEEGTYRDNQQPRLVLLAYTILAIPWIVLDAQSLVGGGSFFSTDFLIKLRLTIVSMALEGEGAYTNKYIVSAFIIGSFTFLIYILEEKRIWPKLLCALYMIVFFLMTTGRGVLTQALCWWLCVALLRRQDRGFIATVKWSAVACIGTIILMTSLTFLTKSRTQGDGELQEASNMTLTYVVGPMAAFDYAVYNPGEFKGQPAAVFQGLRTRLSNLNIIRSIPPKSFNDFVLVPFWMNVYTCFKPYYEYFGVIGCLLVFSVIGLIEGKLFYTAINGNHIAKFFFVYLSYPLIFSTFDDLYTTHNSDVAHVYVVVIAFVYFYIMKRLRFRMFRNPVRMASIPLIVAQE